MNPESEERIQRLLEKLREASTPGDQKIASLLSAVQSELKREVQEQEEKDKMLRAYEEAYEKLTAPANKVGVFLRSLEGEKALVVLGDTEYVALIDPQLDQSLLSPGARIALNDAFAIVGLVETGSTGALMRVAEIMEDERLRVGSDAPGSAGRIITRSGSMQNAQIVVGDEVRLDPSGRVAVEHVAKKEMRDYFMEEVPITPWTAVGGQEKAISLIRETIELPMLHAEIYEKFDKKPVKGILLYGPPGCGKTLIGRAIAYNLAKQYSEQAGREVKEYFMHISGPKILNMWLGETERMVREVFATARDKAKEGRLVVIFIDEAESILRTRSTGRWLNISNTVVPQFCAELDGLVSLENVVLVLTSNRPDYIDPAILRPERIDRKVKIERPDKEASRQILSIYLHDRLPFDPSLVKEQGGEPECARIALVESTLAFLWRKAGETQFLKVSLKNGNTETLHWRDLVSGALLKSIVDRSKDFAIRRAIADPGGGQGLTEQDMHDAVRAEFVENEIFPKSDSVSDWLKLLDFDSESVVNVKPIGIDKGEQFVRNTVV